ncbi:MAG: Crp/Fnr family transcriptional regulator [Armatimonadetes bacterium]|nr:Crp/Fnr family transcriptional regulator [Armatimonadota bacterium]
MSLAALEISNRVGLLKRNTFFKGIDEDILEGIAPRFVCREYKRNEHIWLEGDDSDLFAIIRDGYVKIVKHSDVGKDILLELLGPGDVIGAVALLEGRAYPASAKTLDRTLLLVLSRDEFLDIIAQVPQIAAQALIAIGARLRHAHEMMKQLTVDCVETRIANVLLLLSSRAAEVSANRIVLRVRLTRRDIAEMVGTTLETTIRILSRWEKSGIVTREQGHIVILDMESLKILASDENSAQI